MPIETNRSFGSIGAILISLGVISTASTLIQYSMAFSTQLTSTNLVILGVSSIVGVMSFVGFILFLIALNGFSKDYNENRIFRYILYGLIGAIISGVIIGVIWFIFTFTSIIGRIPGFNSTPNSSDIQSLLVPYYAPFLVAISIVALVWILLNVKALNLLADKSQVMMFKTAANLFLIGAALNITLGVVFAAFALNESIGYNTLLIAGTPGAIIQYVAWAVSAKAFLSIKAPLTQEYTVSNIPLGKPQIKYCPNCETVNQQDSRFCNRCGQSLAKG